MTGYELLQHLSKCDLDLPVVIDCDDIVYDAGACLMIEYGEKAKITIYPHEEADNGND